MAGEREVKKPEVQSLWLEEEKNYCRYFDLSLAFMEEKT